MNTTTPDREEEFFLEEPKYERQVINTMGINHTRPCFWASCEYGPYSGRFSTSVSLVLQYFPLYTSEFDVKYSARKSHFLHGLYFQECLSGFMENSLWGFGDDQHVYELQNCYPAAPTHKFGHRDGTCHEESVRNFVYSHCTRTN